MGSAPDRRPLRWNFRADRDLRCRFREFEVVGEAAQWVVVRATPRQPGGRDVALKLIGREKLAGQGAEQKEARRQATREISNQSRLWHPLIVEYQGVFVSQFYLVIVLQWATVPVRHGRELPSLVDILEFGQEGLSEDMARFYFQQLMVAVEYCHKKQVSNRDLQLDHCLLHDEEGTNKSCLPLLKLCDWGLGTSYRSDDGATESLLGTPGYCAPEVVINGFKKCPYDPCLVDVYACGVILWKLLLGQDSWPDRDPEEEKRLHSQEIAEYYKYYLQKQKDGLHLRITPDNKVSLICKNLLMKMLEPDHRNRCGIKQVLEHPWFTANLNEKSQNLNEKLLNSERLSSIEARAPTRFQVEALINYAASVSTSDIAWAPDKTTQTVAATILDV